MLVLLFLYLSALALVAVYSLAQLQLALLFLFHKWKAKKNAGKKAAETSLIAPLNSSIAPLNSSVASAFPFVTVQLPIYNELYVVEDILRAVAAFDYPLECLEVQILDDSTDETSDIIARIVAEILQLRPQLSILHKRRAHRAGFKAGALAEGLLVAKGEYIAIFDADFVPAPDFLLRTLPYLLADTGAGLVQTRWTHKNENYSILTRMQAFALDAHFSVEQWGRSRSGFFINFNGTAGVWRRACIEASGGWSSDTLTEDLDLSYRAQIAGWRLLYRDDICTPAELPIAMPAIKTQQYRWNKGAAEVARKMLGRLFFAPNISFMQRLNGFAHLLNSSLFVLIFVITVLSVPVGLGAMEYPEYTFYYGLGRALGATLGVVVFFFGVSFFAWRRFDLANFWALLWRLPIFLATMYGLGLFNTLAVVAGWAGRKSPFVRTPKYNLVTGGAGGAGQWLAGDYAALRLSNLWYAEVFLLLYFLSAVVAGLWLNELSSILLYILVAFGYGLVVGYEWLQVRAARRFAQKNKSVAAATS
jgi:cellulose synthase/poly-beta-1,6-N-acetylglucosamine synthase-like glycosyltransferase